MLDAGRDKDQLLLGCCMTVSRNFLDPALPVPLHADGHDKWLSDVALVCGKKKMYGRALQYYRRHSGSVTESVAHERWRVARKFKKVFLKTNKAPSSMSRFSGLKRKYSHYLALSRWISNCGGVRQDEKSGLNSEYFEALLSEYRFRLGVRKVPRWHRWIVILLSIRVYTGNRGGRTRKVLVDLLDPEVR
jgi:hypothetical protein